MSELNKITEKMFKAYKDVQKSGEFNMLDPRAREDTSLDRRQWYAIISNYNELNAKYS